MRIQQHNVKMNEKVIIITQCQLKQLEINVYGLAACTYLRPLAVRLRLKAVAF